MTAGTRIKELRKKAKLSQQAVADFVGVSRAAVTQWEGDLTKPNGASLHSLAKLFTCDTDYILYGEGRDSLEIVNTFEVPLISSVAAGTWSEGLRERPETYVPVTERFPDGSYALRVSGDSMTDPEGPVSIPDGSVVIVVPEYDAISGRIVVAMLEGSEEATVKKLMIDGPMKYLVPLNKRYQPIPINGNCRIVGRVKQVINIQNL